jgi:outer membrane translocation and assembly module TamA
MMLYALLMTGAMLVPDAAPQPQSAPIARFYAGGFRSVRGFEFRSAEPLSERFYAGGFRSVRGFEFHGAEPAIERFYAGGFRSIRGFESRGIAPSGRNR